MKITLYTKPRCVQCTATKRSLDKRGLEYTTIDVSQDEEALARILAAGHMAAPVVEIDGEVVDESDPRNGPVKVSAWGGFRPDLIEQL